MAKSSTSPMMGVLIAVVGIILIIAGGGYALDVRLTVPGSHLTKLAFNPLVDALGIVGLILLIVGAVLYTQIKKNASPAASNTPPSSSQTTDQKPQGKSSSSNKNQ